MKVYLIALFCVALLLLLVSFVMQQRNHLALQDLNDSISNNQAVADLQLENQRLQYELEERKNQEEDLQSQVEEKDKQVQAMEWLRQIEAAVRSSYSEAKTMIEAFEETGLEESLPHRVHGGGRGVPRRCLPHHLRHVLLRKSICFT